MAITEIRESIERSEVTIPIGNRFVILEKKIELKEGRRHTMMSVDFMDDSFLKQVTTAIDAGDLGYEFYLSPYPISLTNQAWANVFTNGGPVASDDAVLFKHGMFNAGGVSGSQSFPNDFLGAFPTFSWYTPTLYATLILHLSITAQSSITIPSVRMSFYASVKDSSASDVEYGMGVMAEYKEAQNNLLTTSGHVIQVNPSASRFFPAWAFGGIRPEFMIKANSDMGFFLSGYMDNTAERMVSNTRVQGFLAESRTMVPFNEAFGRESFLAGGSGVPDWIRTLDLQNEIMYASQRSEFPPHLVTDEGITRMV